MGKIVDLRGQTFGRLTVLELSPIKSAGRNAKWHCRCVCGNEIDANSFKLRHGLTQSCGCLRSEASASRALRHGHAKRGVKSQAWTAWQGMKERCHRPSHRQFHHFGKRGIRVCDAWRESFEAFLADMGEPPPGKVLDRIDKSGHYEPGNCAWVTRSAMASNRYKRPRANASDARESSLT